MFFCLKVIWFKLIRRPLAAASARCHDDVSSVEEGTLPQVSLQRGTIVGVCECVGSGVFYCVCVFSSNYKTELSSNHVNSSTCNYRTPQPSVCIHTSLICNSVCVGVCVCVHRRLISFSSVFQHLGLSLTASPGQREHLYMPLAM